MVRKDDYDWLDDPFNEKKAAREEQKVATPSSTKLALSCGCLVAVVGIIALFLFVAINMVDILTT